MNGLDAFLFPSNFCDDQRAVTLGTMIQDPWAWRYVVKIWCWAAQNIPEGVITGLEAPKVIEAVAIWAGPPGQLFDALVSSGWVDRLGTAKYELHYWSERVLPMLAKIKKNRERASAHYYRGKVDSTRRIRADYAQRVDSPPAPGALLDLPADHPRDTQEASNSPPANSMSPPGVQEWMPLPLLAPPTAKRKRAQSRQDQAYEYFREQRAERTGAPDTKPAAAEFNRRMGELLDEVGVPAWKRIVDAYLADTAYPRTDCVPQWPIRYLLSQYARYYSPPGGSEPRPQQLSSDELVLRAAVSAAYEAQHGDEYPWSVEDERSTRECLVLAGGDHELVAARWEVAVVAKWPKCTSLRHLAQRWADVERLARDAERRERANAPRFAGWK